MLDYSDDSAKTAQMIEHAMTHGWVTMIEGRQPYRVDLCPQLMPQLAEAGFVRVEAPAFKIGEVLYHAKTRMMKVGFPATDKPEDLPVVSTNLVPLLIGHLRAWGSTHVYSVVVSRTAVWGLLPPDVCVSVCSCVVKPAPTGVLVADPEAG